MLLEAVARTDPGPVRENNEDNFFVEVDAGLFIVADGMGGHASGEVASAMAVDAVREIMLGEADPDETRLDRQSPDNAEAIRERLRYAMNQGSVRIRKAAMANIAHAGMGTTLVVLLIENGVIGKEMLTIRRHDVAVGEHRRRVVEVIGEGGYSDNGDRIGHAACEVTEPCVGGGCEPRVQQKILGGISRGRELGEYCQIGALIRGVLQQRCDSG